MEDSDPRSPKATGLQPVPVVRLGNCPFRWSRPTLAAEDALPWLRHQTSATGTGLRAAPPACGVIIPQSAHLSRGNPGVYLFIGRLEDVRLARITWVYNDSMPPWMNTPQTTKTCLVCHARFLAKRDSAKYCSARCQDRMRNRIPPSPAKRRAWREARLAMPGYRERINLQANERATGIRRWLDAYKVEHGCIGCGYRAHPVALHFDHVRGGKTLNVCNAKSIGQAKREIAKCVVRCANCHAIKTWPRPPIRKSP